MKIYIEVYIHTQLYVVETADSVRIRQVSLIQSVLYREVSLYIQYVHTYMYCIHTYFPTPYNVTYIRICMHSNSHCR